MNIIFVSALPNEITFASEILFNKAEFHSHQSLMYLIPASNVNEPGVNTSALTDLVSIPVNTTFDLSSV